MKDVTKLRNFCRIWALMAGSRKIFCEVMPVVWQKFTDVLEAHTIPIFMVKPSNEQRG